MWIKIISENKTDFYTGRLKFAVGEITKVKDEEWNPKPECGGGIHFSQSLKFVLENTNHNQRGYLIEVKPIGEVINIDDKSKSKSVKTVRFLTIPEWLEELKTDDPDEWNRLMRACKVGLEELNADDPDWLNRRMRACKVGLEELKADDPDEWNRLMRACKVGLEELKADDPDEWNRLMRACKVGEWNDVFKVLK